MSSLVVATNREDQVAPIQLALPKDVARRCHARRLPVELWDIIFEDCVPGAPEPSLAAAPLNVSQVCRSWRDISLSNSVLWSILAINTSCRHMEGSHAFERLCDLIPLWLGRSVTRLLSVSLAQSGEDKSTSPLASLLKAVLAHAKQLRGLEVRAPATCLGPLGSPALYLPELEHLKIESPGPELSTAVVLPLDRAPRLRNLAALDISFDAAHISVFDYRQLTELTLLPDVKAPGSVFLSADEALYFLFDAPKLRTLRLAVMDREPRRKTVSQADALHSLSLYFHDARTYMPRRHERIGTFFSLLCTPNLQHLLVKDCGEDDPGFSWPADYLLRLDSWPQKRFAAYLSATQMRTLTLVYIPLYQSQVADCVQRMPQLRELFIEARPHRGSQCNVGDFLLMVLTPSNMALRAVAPALRSIEFRNCGRRCTEQGLVEMIDARHALQYVRLQRTELPTKELAGRVTSWNPNVCECGCARQMGYSVVLDCGRK
ncbi:hypothetical protein DFH06DRAFT_1171753 [Mycena polygramma]|nr:hypothetical protein DFH06DRAFT_1171753 [Mycena polygramma]